MDKKVCNRIIQMLSSAKSYKRLKQWGLPDCQKQANKIQQQNYGVPRAGGTATAADGDKKQMCMGKTPAVETTLMK